MGWMAVTWCKRCSQTMQRESSSKSANSRFSALTERFKGKYKSNLRTSTFSEFKKLINLCIYNCSKALRVRCIFWEGWGVVVVFTTVISWDLEQWQTVSVGYFPPFLNYSSFLKCPFFFKLPKVVLLLFVFWENTRMLK